MQPQPPPVPAPPGSAARELPGAHQLGAARARLASTAELPLADQIIAFDEVHRLLQDALAGVQQISQAEPNLTGLNPAGA